jgi:DNA integrity scanning protein DisA with diadenylate cyclase activity
MEKEDRIREGDLGPSVDFSFQFSAEREFNKVEKKIFTHLCKISEKSYKTKNKLGILVVLGSFDNNENHIIRGMRQIGVNPIQKYLNVSNTNFDDEITKLLIQNHDGAYIVNRTGQLLGAKLYLTVEKHLEVPDGCGTRHITAASFSTSKNVLAVFTLSEETCIVRTWKDGNFVDQFLPEENEE